ncbi:FAD:protein FMN transferase [Tepidimicrobium xylanilyticum]|uniref:FAD:protein FMN transferase n=1 Tax=Tepidimicrobium xylanilyticum TaxID=1123352 RepID=A0A1H3BTM6_9FIRM|nr:FAD:protein FMN transferase [Tepidimicrobium xylanilyticum]SDX45257.1 thiamine biosynthesis lipoprotein [Tepidimicrobium xylanilyticum]
MKSKKSILLLIVIILLQFTVGCKKDVPGPLAKSEFLMNTYITLRIYDKKDKNILDKAFDRLREIENRMSVTIEDSDVSLINQNAGIKPVKVHEDVYYVIKEAKYFAELSNGAFDPTIGPLTDLWNITGDELRERESIPTEDEIKEALELVDYRDLELLEDNQVFLKKEGMKLNLGGIVKGYAADEVKRIFLENGVESAIIDLGGNLYVMGEKEDGEAWKIGIQDPFKEERDYLGILKVKNKSVVTSGDYERYIIYNGEKYHHILDPKTGYPSENEVSGITIISDKSIVGDGLSTALFILGVEGGSKLVNQLGDIQAIFVTKMEEVIVHEDIIEDFSLRDSNYSLILNQK